MAASVWPPAVCVARIGAALNLLDTAFIHPWCQQNQQSRYMARGDTKLFGPHTFTWKTRTPPQGVYRLSEFIAEIIRKKYVSASVSAMKWKIIPKLFLSAMRAPPQNCQEQLRLHLLRKINSKIILSVSVSAMKCIINSKIIFLCL